MSDAPLGSVSFERVAKAKVVGCVAYALMIPVIGLLGAILGAAAGAGIAALFGGGETLGTGLMLGFALIGLVGFAAFGIRDYHSRSIDCVHIHDDRLELRTSKKSVIHRFDDIHWIEGPGLTGLTLKPAQRPKLCLKAEEWPIDGIREALVRRAVPAMVRGMNARIQAGEALEFRPANLLGLRLLVVGTVLIALSGLLFHRWSFHLQGKRETMQLGVPLFLLGSGVTSLFQAARARGGVLVDRDGVRLRKNDPVIPWPRLLQLTPAGSGMILETDDGRKLRIGMLTRNYEACLAILKTWMVTTE